MFLEGGFKFELFLYGDLKINFKIYNLARIFCDKKRWDEYPLYRKREIEKKAKVGNFFCSGMLFKDLKDFKTKKLL